MIKLLTICIPSVLGREKQFNELVKYLASESNPELTEIIHEVDNKEMTIGAKRNKLHQRAAGLFTMTIDDDDWLMGGSISKIENIIKENSDSIDCIGYKELCIFNGKKVESSAFSLRYHDWDDNVDGFNHVRTPFFKTPIRTDIVKDTLVEDSRFGEDHAFARAIKPKLRTEYFMDEFVYIYRHNDEGQGHNERYGIK